MSKAESRLEKVAREGAAAMARHESDSRAVREKTVRLRALRLAKEAADLAAAQKSDGAKSDGAKSDETVASNDV